MKIRLIPCIILMLILTSCGSNNTNNMINLDITEKEVRFIGVDYNTVKVSEYESITEEPKGTIFSEEDEEKHSVNELDISGTVNIDWETLEDGSIIYNNITFNNLNNIVSSIEKPCSNEALIKFILNTFKPTDNTVYCMIEIYDSEDIGDNTSILEEELNSFYNYTSISNKYNDKVSWILTVYEYGMKHYGKIYGCPSFMICRDVGKDNVVIFDENTNIESENISSEEVNNNEEEINNNNDDYNVSINGVIVQ